MTGVEAIDRMPGHQVRRLQQVAVRLFSQQVGADLTPVQFATLAALAEHPGLDQRTLGALIGYDAATIGGVIDRMQAKGLLERLPSPTDRRVRLVQATPAGLRALGAALPAVHDVQQQLLAPLDGAERRQFERLCRKLLEHHLG